MYKIFATVVFSAVFTIYNVYYIIDYLEDDNLSPGIWSSIVAYEDKRLNNI